MFTKQLCLVIGSLLVVATASCRAKNNAPPNDPAAKPTAAVEPPQNGEVASYNFQVAARDGKCVFTYDGPSKGELITDLNAPCNFSRGHTGGVQHIVGKRSGKAGGDYTVILLIGGPAAAAHPECGTETQPISLSPRGVALGCTGGGIPICPSADLDRPWFGVCAKPV